MFDSTAPKKKEIRNLISELVNKTISKKEIYNEVTNKFPDGNRDFIAREIASYITDEVKNKFRYPAYLLTAILIIELITMAINPLTYKNEFYNIYLITFQIAVVIISVFFINGFLKFKLWYYTTAVSYLSLCLLIVAYNWIARPHSSMLLLTSIYTIITLIYLIFLRKGLFPNINFFGNVKKHNGEYEF